MISAVTPTVRPDGLLMVAKCLERQTHQDFEWLVVAPQRIKKDACRVLKDYEFTFVTEPPLKKGDFYGLNKAMNKAYSLSSGDLIIEVVDLIWFPPDTLERFWRHYLQHPKGSDCRWRSI